MSRGYGKYRRGGNSSHSSFHFDNLFKENTNKPSAARSAATVGKWGITSFTSIRTINGAKLPSPPVSEKAPPVREKPDNAAPKPKKFFKSRNKDSKDAPSPDPQSPLAAKKFKLDDAPAKPRRFFSTKQPVLSQSNSPDKPPIILKISRGKSQLVSDSEESESAPKSPNARMKRAVRRSLAKDPDSSPKGAESEFLALSPEKEGAQSPQYIPAEEYEAERRAMYDNLLKPTEESEKSEERDDKMPVLEPVLSPKQPESFPEKRDEPPVIKEAIEDDWGTDSDSNEPQTNSQETEEEEEEPILDEKEKDETPSLSLEPSSDVFDNFESLESADDERKVKNEPPSVKLLISKKKGSIFKSRLTNDDTKNKRRALYTHKWCDDKDGNAPGGGAKTVEKDKGAGGASQSVYDDFDAFNDDPLERVTKNLGENDDDDAVTSVKCTKSDKGFYTVVRNVKKAHQIQEIGEFQEFNDDVEYILDALQDNNPISTRCLSAITLASKCMVPAFRMHVRAHGTVAKFFKALHDATKDQSLGLCTATVMFVLSQDRLNMDLDRDCLELMLNLLESDVSYQQALDVCGLSSAQLEKNKQKVRELCAEIQSQGHAMHLNLDNITVGQLAMETLLSLTSKRAGEWFKEELRELGGLEHIMKTICECCRQVSDYVVSWTDILLDKLRKVDRCLRVLENVTHNNEENQTYLLNYNQGIILDTLVNLYKLCDGEIPLYPVTDIADKESTGTIIREALLVTLKVLINLTHHFKKQSTGSGLIGSRPGIIDTSLHLLLQVPHYIPEQKKFELGVLVLMLLINLIQDNNANQKLLMDAKAPSKSESIYSREESAVEALIAQFYHWEGCAKIAEKRTNAILDGEKEETDAAAVVQPKTNEEFIEETVAKLLQKAGTHMEYTFLASYIVMLVGFLIMENSEFQTCVRQFLKGNNFADMVELLKKFFNFMNLTASTEASSVCAIKATEKVIKFLEQCDKDTETSKSTPETTTYNECFYYN